jgi:hypothetical protein
VLSLGFSLAINEINKLSNLSFFDLTVLFIMFFGTFSHLPPHAGPAGRAFPMRSNIKARKGKIDILSSLTAIAISC